MDGDLYDGERPAWPTRSPLDPASVRAFWHLLVGALLDRLCRSVIEEAIEERKVAAAHEVG